MVVQTLAHNSTATLATVRDYIVKRLQAENELVRAHVFTHVFIFPRLPNTIKSTAYSDVQLLVKSTVYSVSSFLLVTALKMCLHTPKPVQDCYLYRTWLWIPLALSLLLLLSLAQLSMMFPV